MLIRTAQGDIKELVDGLNFARKVDRSPGLIRQGWEEFGERLVVANSLGKDSAAVEAREELFTPVKPGTIARLGLEALVAAISGDQAAA